MHVHNTKFPRNCSLGYPTWSTLKNKHARENGANQFLSKPKNKTKQNKKKTHTPLPFSYNPHNYHTVYETKKAENQIITG